jgi:antitoxin CptB
MDSLRKRLRFRAWRRGFREIDLIMGAYADRRLAGLDASGLRDFERLLDTPDQDVYAWILGAAAPAEFETPVLAELRAMRLGAGDHS